MAAPQVRVLRDTRISEIDGRELVPGDLIYLEAGDRLDAHRRLIEAVQLQIRESALTGEATIKTAQTIIKQTARAAGRVASRWGVGGRWRRIIWHPHLPNTASEGWRHQSRGRCGLLPT
jgi:magnesium-transporting ATPase (P-type)